MSLVDDIFNSLLHLLDGGPSGFGGTVTDEIGLPIEGARVRALALGLFAGRELAAVSSDAAGAFALGGALPEAFLVEVSARGARRVFLPTSARTEVRLLTPLRLTGSVGDGGDNRPHDVRRLQDRLHRWGRLSAADVAAEPVDLTGLPPVPLGPRLMAALAAHLTACFGRPLPRLLVKSHGPTWQAMAEDPPFPLTHFGLGCAVGKVPGGTLSLNAPPTVALVQGRLAQLGRLSAPAFAAEAVDGTDPSPALDPDATPRTLAAILAFERDQTGGALQAIVPGAPNEHRLNDPLHCGRPACVLQDAVGAGARNLPADVRTVQEQLLLLGHLTSTAELVDPAAAAVADGALPLTFAAIQALRRQRLGETAPEALLDPVDACVRRLNRPAPLELTDTVGWNLPVAAANRPGDVRRLQDRLLWLGFLSQAEYDQERVDPNAEGRIDQGLIPRTAAALALASEQRAPLPLTASVGRGAVNHRPEVRQVQDRLRGLLWLEEADYQRELIDPVQGAPIDQCPLDATFAALEGLRAKVFELPAAGADPWTAQAWVEPGDETQAFLANALFYGRQPLALRGSVGSGGWNFPEDVRQIQERLRAMRLLSSADFATEVADPLSPTRLENLQLSATREAIVRLHRAILGAARPAERVEARSPALVALEDRLGALRAPLDLQGSVGYDGANAPADVQAVQARLFGLGFLSAEDYRAEGRVAPIAPATALLGSQIPATIDALATWQYLMLDQVIQPIVEPFSATQRSLLWPPLPRAARLELTDSVGQGGANGADDLRLVQDRLFELGLMPAEDYFRDRGGTDATSTGAALRTLQGTLAGLGRQLPTGLVSPGAHSHRVLQDPTFGTPAAPNPHCVRLEAGPARAADPNLVRLVLALRTIETGVSVGEIPAVLRNASGTPTSWGKLQVIGQTAIGTLAQFQPFYAFYGLSSARANALVQLATNTVNRFVAIGPLVTAALSEAQLVAKIAAYVAAEGAKARQATGLGPDDLGRMFRAAQLRLHLLAQAAAHRPAAELFDAAAHPAAAANLAALGLTPAEAQRYQDKPDFHGEHRGGFVTRALFHAPEGQLLRAALTDDSGQKLGEFVVRSNWDRTAGLGLDATQRVQLTTYLHNHGGNPTTLAADMTKVTTDDYVIKVMAVYTTLP